MKNQTPSTGKTFLGLSFPAAAILFLGVALRALGLSRPLLGHFSMYQTANAMMARFFIENHFTSILYPTINVLVHGKPGLLILAYPVNALVAALFNAALGGSLDFWGRFQSLVFYSGSLILLYRFVRERYDEITAVAAALVFSLSPLTIIYAQSFQNEMATVFFTMLFFSQYSSFLKSSRFAPALMASFAAGMVLITRPNLMYIFLLTLTLTVFECPQDSFWKKLQKWFLIAAGSMLIPIAWYGHVWHVTRHVTNIYSTLFAQLAVRSSFVSPIIFTIDYYQKLFDVFTSTVMTPIGLFLLIWGIFIVSLDFKKYIFWLVWIASFAAAGILMPRKLIDHDFYFLHLIAPASVVIAAGIISLLKLLPNKKTFLFFLIALSFAVSMRYALHPAFKATAEDRNLLRVAAKVRQMTDKKTSRIVVQGSHPLLYYADRYGWPFVIGEREDVSDYYTQGNWEKLSREQWIARNEAYKRSETALEYLRSYEGATHFAVSDLASFNKTPFAQYLRAHYRTVYEDPNTGALFDLQAPLK